MLLRLDYSHLRLIESLATHGPRNLAEVARELDILPGTLRKKLKRLRSHIFLRFGINIYHTYLGLKKAIVFAETIPGYEELLFESLKTNEFWIYVSRCYGINESCFAIYTIPKEHENDFGRFLEEIQRIGVARNIQFFWSTCFQSIYSLCNWFDPKSGNWDFQWNKWLEEIPTEETKLPYTLVDPEDWPIKGDEVDVLILKELEKDATISFVGLAKKFNLSPQLVGYHYRNHLQKKALIESFSVDFFHFEKSSSDRFFFIFRFDDLQSLAKFTSSLLDKPFARIVGKILEENSLFGYIYLPKLEFANFIDALARLIRRGHLKSYRYMIQHPGKVSRETIPYQCFKERAWTYKHDKYLRDLHELVKENRLKSAE